MSGFMKYTCTKQIGSRLIWAAFMILLIAGLSGCSAVEEETETAVQANREAYPREAVELIAPAGVGSGYDLTARSVSNCLRETGLVSVPLPVTNKAGEGGGIALRYLSDNQGADGMLSVFSAPLCLINLNGSTKLRYDTDTTPVARLIMDYGCFAVTADSPYHSINDVIDALKENPQAVRIGGTSSVGSMDHIQFLKIAQAAGVSALKEISYVGFEDGSASAQLMGGHIDLISTGISDVMGLVESGDLRVLAITARKRVGSGIVAEMPTCIEQGIPASFYNWRGLFGPKDMPKEALLFWEETIRKMTETTEWKEICEEYGWDIAYQDHEAFVESLAELNEEYAALLNQIGLLQSDLP